MSVNFVEMLRHVYLKNKRVSKHWLHENYPNLIQLAIDQYGSLNEAVKKAGIDYYEFLSGFDPETSHDLNVKFINLVTDILKAIGITLSDQNKITYPKDVLDPIRIDQKGNWYVIKIIPWSNLTEDLIIKIRKLSTHKITVIYLKERGKKPDLYNVEFIDARDYLTMRNIDAKLIEDMKTIAACLSYVKFEI